jgi:2-keto-4-pentenoate hydratase/2-oxohepta-3-ene-1,7-dioic acid hydratase in catechol pathway
MASRRNFLKTVGAASAGLTAASMTTAAQAAGKANAPHASYNGPHKMPTGVKLLMMKNADGSESLGAVTDKGVIDIRSAAAKYHIAAPLTLDELLQGGNADGLNRVIDKARSSGEGLIDESKINHAKMFAHPSKIMCVGLNYRQHAKEVGMKEPSVPVLFNKYDNTLTGHNTTIKLPPKEVAYKFDYETELLIVIGKPARNVPEADALSYVAGYCTAQDFSARDLQLELPSGQWMIGKTLDDFAPIGPYFVSADLVGDPNNLKIQTRVNGELRQSSNTNDFIFNTQQMVSYISRFWTLNPGDIIFTGTPQGVIAGLPKEKQMWLKAGDEIVSSIEKLGDLKFRLA